MRNEQQIVELAKAIKAAPKILQPLRIHELLDLIDPPQTTVDWGKAIGTYFGEKLEELELIGPLDPPDHTGCTRVVYSRTRNALYTCMEDGTNGLGSEVRVINIYAKPDPAPVELAEGYRWSIATDGEGNESIAIESIAYGWIHLLDFVGKDCYFSSRHKAEVAGWSFGVWQEVSFRHPRTVSG